MYFLEVNSAFMYRMCPLFNKLKFPLNNCALSRVTSETGALDEVRILHVDLSFASLYAR